MTTRCQYCGNEVPDGSSTCPVCNAPQTTNQGAVDPASGSNPGGFAPAGGANPGGFVPAGGANPGGFAPAGGANPGGFAPAGGANPGGFAPPGGSPPPAAPNPVGFTPPIQPEVPKPKSAMISTIFWIAFVVVMIGVGIYTSSYGCGLPPGCVREDPVSIQLNQTVQGELTTFHTYRLYELNVTAPTQVQISLNSTYDNFLELYLGESQSPMMQNDDGGAGLNALIATMLAPGVYYILVRPYSEGTGPFTLSVTGAPMGGGVMPMVPQ